MFAYKGIGYPILWNGAIPIDCFINPNGNVIINTIQLDKTEGSGIQSENLETFGLSSANLVELKPQVSKTIWEAAIKFACDSKICH
ncbi:MAG: hypothetical protein EZS28_050126 [Streblomastix strix]|uniref:Uncharacterized protein n=1 Tax=Streblomastix strix TaxID=222440 RepID=A0A5J4T812_9EUKA|nr:MAG: hypothetical protein EZS28_050126 [Streblomastix strix]